VQVGAANPRRIHFDHNFFRAGNRRGQLFNTYVRNSACKLSNGKHDERPNVLEMPIAFFRNLQNLDPREIKRGTNMRNLLFLPLVLLGYVTPLILSSCASSDTPLQSRIERKIETPNNGNVEIGTAHYNQYSQQFEEPWPFGPYSTFLISRSREGEQP
jgi:hypothetical protein